METSAYSPTSACPLRSFNPGLALSLFSLVLSIVAIPTNAMGADPDRTPPTLRIVEPTTGTEIGGDALTVEIEYRDAGSGIAARTLPRRHQWERLRGTVRSAEPWLRRALTICDDKGIV